LFCSSSLVFDDILIAVSAILNPFDSWSFLLNMHFLDIFSLVMGQISSSLLKKAFATRQHVLLSISTAFSTFLFGHAQKSKEKQGDKDQL